jgi:hypothetical protein
MILGMNKSYKFTVELNGTTYDCERCVTSSKDYLQQNIVVSDVGSMHDGMLYGTSSKYSPISTMESAARLIASQVIKEARVKQEQRAIKYQNTKR